MFRSGYSAEFREYGWPHALAAAGLCLAIGLGFFWLYSRIGQQGDQMGEKLAEVQSETSRKLQELPKSQEELRGRLAEVENTLTTAADQLNLLKQEANQREATNALTLAKTTGLHHQGEAIRERLRDLGHKLAQWNVRRDALLSRDNEDGRRIADVPELVAQFMAIEDQPLPSERNVTDWQEELDNVLTPVNRAYREKDSTFQADESLVAKFEELEKAADEALDQLERHQVTVAAILDQAPGTQPTGGGLSLQEAMDAQRKKWAAEDTRIINEVVDRARLEAAQRIAEAKAEAVRLVGEQKAKTEQLLGEQEAQRLAEMAEDAVREERERMEKRQQELARQQLENEFQAALAEIRSLLKPFLTDGYTQPSRHGTFERTTEKGPVSFSRLKGAGLLEKDVEIISRLHFVTTANRMNDRPYGSFPPQGLGSAHRAQSLTAAQRAQELLNKYGELMVSKDMLAP